MLESAHRLKELVTVDVDVARDLREVGATEVSADEARVDELLAKPGRGGLAQLVGCEVRRDVGAPHGAADVGVRRLLKASARESARKGLGRRPLAVEQPQSS